MFNSEKTIHHFFPLLVSLFLLTLLISSFRGRAGYSDYVALLGSKGKLEKSMQELRADVARLTSEIDKITHSPAYAEKVFKDKYHTVKGGETIVFFAD